MSELPAACILVVVVDSRPELEELAVRRNWPVLKATTVEPVLRETLHFTPRAAIVGFCMHVDEALELIGALRNRWPQIPLIAVSGLHNREIESAVRGAGASYYFTGSRGVELADQALTAIIAKGSLSGQAHPSHPSRPAQEASPKAGMSG